VTSLKEAERVFGEGRSELEEKVAERTRELNAEVEKHRETGMALEMALRRLDAHITNTPLAVVELDADLRVVRWSLDAAKVFLWTESEACGRKLGELGLVYEGDMSETMRVVEDLKTGRRPRVVHRNRNYRKDGRILTCDWYNSAIYDEEGRLVSVLAMALDITERLRADEELARAKEASDTANRAKTMFLANMSHEIRTPMNSIIGFTQLVLRAPGLSELHREHLQLVESSSQHLLQLIDDILEVSRVELGRCELAEATFDLEALLSALEQTFRMKAVGKGLMFVVEKLGLERRWVSGDETKLRQIFNNLISNAVKFTKQGEVRLRVRLSDAGEGHLRLDAEVEDTGVGIPDEALPLIFGAFWQGRRTSGVEDGTGLGLSIAKQFVALMGGVIGVESRVGKGTIFRFHVFVGAVETMETRALEVWDGERSVEASGMKILIVDDVASNRLFLRCLLAEVGFQLREASDGLEALEVEELWRPDLILMDTRMPGMDGVNVVRVIRARRGTGGRPRIISVSANALPEDQRLAMLGGSDAYLTKPVHEGRLFASMESLLGIRFRPKKKKGSRSVAAEAWDAVLSDEEALSRLPSSFCRQIRDALERADYEMVKELIGAIGLSDSRLAGAFHRLAADFDAERLLRVIPIR